VTNRLFVFDSDYLNVVCHENEVKFAFDQTNVGWDELMGKSMAATLTSVKDLVGNPMEETEIVHIFSHAMVNESSTAVLFDIELTRACSSDALELRADIARHMHLQDQTRVSVQSSSCSTDQTAVFVTYKVIPSNQVGAPARRLTAIDVAPSTHVARLLVEKVREEVEPKLKIRSVRLLLGEEDKRLRDLDLRLQLNVVASNSSVPEDAVSMDLKLELEALLKTAQEEFRQAKEEFRRAQEAQETAQRELRQALQEEFRKAQEKHRVVGGSFSSPLTSPLVLCLLVATNFLMLGVLLSSKIALSRSETSIL